MQVKIKKLHPNAIIPRYQTEGASGFDFHALESGLIHPGDTVLIRTGLSFKIPEGYELQIRPRSGLSLKTSLRIANSPGTVDSDFLGEVCIIAWNSMEPLMKGYDVSEDDRPQLEFKAGDRIAQGVICPIVQAEFEEVEEIEELDKTERGSKGFGSSGK